jgi:hypothetical protein
VVRRGGASHPLLLLSSPLEMTARRCEFTADKEIFS